jgi:hypothetical protein
MKLGQALATTAVTGMLAALTGGCGGAPEAGASAPKAPTTDVVAPQDKNCCKGRNACKAKSGCKTETNASCAGQNDCKGKGTSCPRG